MIKLAIVDDHPLVREGLKKVMASGTIDLEVVVEAANADDIMRMLVKTKVDIIILDISMPGKSGIDVLKDLKIQFPTIPVLILSMHPENRFAVRALKAGASGYLTKSSVAEELVAAIRMIVQQKKRYISTAVAEQLADELDNSGAKLLHESLSDREYQILCMIASGKKVRLIAEELSLSVQTIHTYRARLKDKMNMRSNVEFALYVIQHNLLD